MSTSARILSEASGSLASELMFVGEAPGRLGADQTAIPFHGDAAGHNFERLLQEAGLDRNVAFVTNAVLCNPRDERGNNATPNDQEVSNCSAFLRRQIDLVNPRVVVTLGQRALSAMARIESHSLALAANVAILKPWYNRLLMPLYHPGARAIIHRPYAVQLEDYKRLATHFIGPSHEMSPTDLAASIFAAATRPVSYFALHKVFYIAEARFAKRYGRRLTNAYIVRQAEGPYVTNLHLRKLYRSFSGLQTFSKGGKLHLSVDKSPDLTLFQKESGQALPQSDFLTPLLEVYLSKSDSQLKTIAYLTSPMRKILALEKLSGIELNRPIRLVDSE